MIINVFEEFISKKDEEDHFKIEWYFVGYFLVEKNKLYILRWITKEIERNK